MKIVLLFFTLNVMCTFFSFSQNSVTLLQDNFENGPSGWTLGGSALTDAWVVDTNYQGLIMDMGIIQIPIFPNSPQQPGTYTGAPRSSYMHIQSPMLCTMMSYCNATYSSTGTFYSTTSQPVDFTDYEDVAVSFGFFSQGHVDSAYAYLEYSLDSITWNEVGNKLYNTSSWQDVTVSIPQLNGAAQGYFRFKWFNLGYSQANLGIGVDGFKVTATEVQTSFILNASANQTGFCSGIASPVTANFESSGVFSNGNVFSLLISDASGNFTGAQTIGTFNSSANGNLSIAGTIPSSLPAGANYLLKITSSAPAVETILSAPITIHATPQVSASPNQTITLGESVTLTASGAATYSWSPSAGLNIATGSTVIATPNITTTYTVTGTDANQCSSSATVVVTVNSNLSVEDLTKQKIAVYPNPSTDYFILDIKDQQALSSIEVFTAEGKKFNGFSYKNGRLDISQNGMYFVRLVIDNQSIILKCVKE